MAADKKALLYHFPTEKVKQKVRMEAAKNQVAMSSIITEALKQVYPHFFK